MFDLGGISIETYISKGHTTASTLFIDKDNKIVFTGDQFGSGCGVWMQVNEAYPLSIYVEEIDRFLNYLSNDEYKLYKITQCLSRPRKKRYN